MTVPCTGSFEALMYRTKSAIPPSYMYSAARSSSWRWSVMVMARFLLRNAISCIRRDSVSKSHSVLSKICVVGPERDRGAGLVAGCAADQWARRIAALVGLSPDVSVPADLHVEPGRQRVHHRHADAVQAAGHGVGLAVELAARVQGRHHDLDRRAVFHRVLVHGNAAAVVPYPHPAVGEQRHVDRVAVASQRLVYGVVHDLVDEMMQSALAGRADVHTWALADSLKPLKYPDRACIVGQTKLHPA